MPSTSPHQPVAMETITIPISVHQDQTQRTLKLVGRGLRSILTTKVSGTLTIRKKTATDGDYQGILPWNITPAQPKPTDPARTEEDEEDPKDARPLPTVKTSDTHEDLLSRQIKVRDFAYGANRVGHLNPAAARPTDFLKEAEDTPVTVEMAPMPSVSTTWTEAHPSLLPLPDYQGTVVEVPTPSNPYRPVYETHRIPSQFKQVDALLEIEARLAENPRTVPIQGINTRRLLTLHPELVDLTRYDEMDLEELRRYDRVVIWLLMNGIEPYPWRTVLPQEWLPSPKTRQKIVKHSQDTVRDINAAAWEDQLAQWERDSAEDDLWEDDECYKCSLRNKTSWKPQGHHSRFDTLDKDMLTQRQRLTIWEKRKDTSQAHKYHAGRYTQALRLLKEMRANDAAQRGEDVDAEGEDVDAKGEAETEMIGDMPFTEYIETFGPFPLWGPKAPHTGAAYRRATALPTGKTLNDYLQEFSRYKATVPQPTPLDEDTTTVRDTDMELADGPAPCESLGRKRGIEEVEPAAEDETHAKRARK